MIKVVTPTEFLADFTLQGALGWVKQNVSAEEVPPRFPQFGRTVNRRIKIGHRDGWVCGYCNVQTSFRGGTLDHIVPVSKGGKNDWGNLFWACKPCNQKKADKLVL